MTPEARTRAQRRLDTEHRLDHDIDLWVATASPDGAPYLVPLSFDWDGEVIVMATAMNSPTARNLTASRTVRLALGHTRDVILIEGDVQVLEMAVLAPEKCDHFAARSGFDPRVETTPYGWFLVTPRRIQAWREVNELADRDLMRDGRWAADAWLDVTEATPEDPGGVPDQPEHPEQSEQMERA